MTMVNSGLNGLTLLTVFRFKLVQDLTAGKSDSVNLLPPKCGRYDLYPVYCTCRIQLWLYVVSIIKLAEYVIPRTIVT